jgi:hypothetical protein
MLLEASKQGEGRELQAESSVVFETNENIPLEGSR